MYEMLFATVEKDRYKLHQLIEDFKEVHNLKESHVLYFVVPNKNAIIIRSDKAFAGCKEVKFDGNDEVDLFVEYCTKGSRSKGSKSVVRTDEQVVSSLMAAFEAGGLNIETLEIKKRYIDNVGMTKGRSSFGIPIAQVSVNAVIDDKAKFESLMMRGLGKRKSFGCGMVLAFSGVI